MPDLISYRWFPTDKNTLIKILSTKLKLRQLNKNSNEQVNYYVSMSPRDIAP